MSEPREGVPLGYASKSWREVGFGIQNTLGGLGLIAFYSTLWFIYPIQVIFLNKYLGIIPYLFLAPCLVYLAANINLRPANADFGQRAVLFLIGMQLVPILHSIVIEFYRGSSAEAFRMICIYAVPLLASFYILGAVPEECLFRILKGLILAACIYSVMILYESVNLEPIWYERQHALYAQKYRHYSDYLLGVDSLRPLGFYFDFKVTSFFIGFGLVGSLAFYLPSGLKRFLLTALTCVSGLVLTGGRLAIIASLMGISFLALAYFTTPVQKSSLMKRCFLFFCLSLAVIAGSYLLTRHNTLFWELIYVHVLKTGEFIPGKSVVNDVIVSSLTEMWGVVADRPLLHIIAGYGITTLSVKRSVANGDFFVLQLVQQLGVLGVVVFYSMLFAGIFSGIRSLKKVNTSNLPLILFPTCLLAMITFSTVHSDMTLNKSIYALVFLALGIIARPELIVHGKPQMPESSAMRLLQRVLHGS